MKFKSQVFTQASGSVDGLVYSHNAGGKYVRARSIPTDPASAFQVSVRGILGTLATRWAATLSSGQRDQWSDYAAAVPVLNTLGDQIFLSGISMYIRCNTPRGVAGLAYIDAGPTDLTMPGLDLPSALAVNDGNPGTADVQWNAGAGQVWTGDTNNAALVFSSRQQSPTVNFFKGPYRFAGLVRGTPSANLPLPFAATADNKTFLRFVVTMDDGRLSEAVRTGTIVVP